MDYEKKLALAKEALESGSYDRETIKYIFPELKESEDERIKKAIIESLPKYGYLPQTSIKVEDAIAWLEKQGEQDMIPLDKVIKFLDDQLVNDKDEVTGEPFINFQNYGAFKESFISYFKRKMLEKQGKDKEINNFDVLPGLYKCVHRMFDGTPDGKLLFEVGNIYKCLSKHDRAEFEVSYGHSVYLEDPVVCKHFIPFEKQGEQKPTDKLEPKFKVGDWITDGNITIQIEAIKNNCYLYCGDCALYSIKTADKVYHLWTIQDAKDGDVLQLGKVTVIFKEFIGNENCKCYCSVYEGEFEVPTQDNNYGCYNATPATKEQCDLLFSKMKEAGYEWDAENKKLKKEEEVDNLHNYLYGEQNLAWSEEDEEMFDAIIADIQFTQKTHNHEVNQVVYEREIDWLKSFKDRVQPQWKPSEEQMKSLSLATQCVYAEEDIKNLNSLYEQLKKL